MRARTGKKRTRRYTHKKGGEILISEIELPVAQSKRGDGERRLNITLSDLVRAVIELARQGVLK